MTKQLYTMARDQLYNSHGQGIVADVILVAMHTRMNTFTVRNIYFCEFN
jgi:hypothetical protein